MKSYVLYDEKGEIVKSGQCSTAKFKRLSKKRKLILEGVGNDETHKVEDGKLAPKEVEEKAPPVEFFRAIITQEQWETVLKRLDNLASK